MKLPSPYDFEIARLVSSLFIHTSDPVGWKWRGEEIDPLLVLPFRGEGSYSFAVLIDGFYADPPSESLQAAWREDLRQLIELVQKRNRYIWKHEKDLSVS